MTPSPRSRPFDATLPSYPFHDPADKRRFLRLVRDRLGRGGHRVVIRDGAALVEGHPGWHSLRNLAQTCRQHPPAEWPRLVDHHFDLSDRLSTPEVVGDVFGGELDHQLDRVGVRIHPEEFVASGLGQHVLHRCDLPGTVSTLTLDVGPSVMQLPPLVAREWGLAEDELFARALRNLDALCTARWRRLSVPYGHGVELDVLCDDFYAAACALRPRASLPRVGRHGNLLAIPTRELLLSWPLDDLRTMHAIEVMVGMSCQAHRDGPGSIVPDLYWRGPDDRWERQRAAFPGGRVQLSPGPGFAALLERR
ncbi:MAG: hypothetical protein R3F29_10390 [Planctomycetota bacterium]